MGENNTYYEDLISRYLGGEASPEDISRLEAWLEADPANKAIFREMRRAWSIDSALRVDQLLDTDVEWAGMAERIGISEEPKSRQMSTQTRRSFLRIAAVFLLLIIPSMVYYWFFLPAGRDLLVAETHMVETELSDGTQVALNAGSTLNYPKEFEGKERKVSLDGEAYFDVAHVDKKAFVINARDLNIRVLGTSFYVNTRAENQTMEVVLMEGSVQLEYNDKNMLLEPGDKAVVLLQHGDIVKQTNRDPNLLAWKTRKLQFDNTPMQEIVEVLENVYHKKIVVLNPDINNCRITATFERESLETVLMVLQSTIDIRVRPNGDSIELSGKGCQ